MKFQKTLMTFLIVSKLTLNGAVANDIPPGQIIPLTLVSPNSVIIELPMPVTTERQKFVINVTFDNGFICHNFLREKEIKDKLFSLETKAALVPIVENKLLEKEKPVTLFESSTLTSASLGILSGLIIGFFISKK
jgi:hypothetical protein